MFPIFRHLMAIFWAVRRGRLRQPPLRLFSGAYYSALFLVSCHTGCVAVSCFLFHLVPPFGTARMAGAVHACLGFLCFHTACVAATVLDFVFWVPSFGTAGMTGAAHADAI